MSADVFAHWLEAQGHPVIRSDSSYWVEAGPRVYQAFPYHWQIDPGEDELKSLLTAHNLIALRYSTPPDAAQGLSSYHVVFDSPPYRIEDLKKKARYDVRKGLKHAAVQPVSFERMANEGWSLRQDTLKRQGRQAAESQSWWRALCLAAADTPGFEAWAALIRDQMGASLIAFSSGDCCSILYQQSATEYLDLSVNNTLTFVYTDEVLQRPGIKELFYGLHSLDAPASVDQFKFRMGYRARQVKQRVVFHPVVAPFVNSVSYRVIQRAQQAMPQNAALAKAEGMLRFYLDGMLPTYQQSLSPDLEKASGETES